MQAHFIAILSTQIFTGANAIAQIFPSPTHAVGIAIGTTAGF